MKIQDIWPDKEKPDDSPAAKAFRLLVERRNLRHKMHNPHSDHLFKVHQELHRRIGFKLKALPVTRTMIRKYADSIKSEKHHQAGQIRGHGVPRAVRLAQFVTAHA